MAVRSRHVLASENRAILCYGPDSAALLNAVSRSTLGWSFERALFYDGREVPPFFDVTGFPLQRVKLTRENLQDAIVATGSIPLVLSGVRDIAGARPGVYRDGGVIDYHLDLPHSAEERLTLFPHFYGHIVPGWFDKRLKWRRPQPGNVDRTILISPSDEFVASLPNSKIPDQKRLRELRTGRTRAHLEALRCGLRGTRRRVSRGNGEGPTGGTPRTTVIVLRANNNRGVGWKTHQQRLPGRIRS